MKRKKDEERAGMDVAESEKELIDKAIQEFMLDNGFSGDKIHHHLRAEYDCFVERAGCRGNGHQSHGMTCLYRGMRPDRKNANELLYMQVGAFTTEEKCLKKYVGTQWSDMFQMWKNNQAAACKGALNALNDVGENEGEHQKAP